MSECLQWKDVPDTVLKVLVLHCKSVSEFPLGLNSDGLLLGLNSDVLVGLV